MLNMQSANAGSIGGVGGGIPAPQAADNNILGNAEVVNTKTNSETITAIDTNHEGIIVSIEDSFLNSVILTYYLFL